MGYALPPEPSDGMTRKAATCPHCAETGRCHPGCAAVGQDEAQQWGIASEVADRYFDRGDDEWSGLATDVYAAQRGDITPTRAPASPAEVWNAACLICGAPVPEHADRDHTPLDPAAALAALPPAEVRQDDELRRVEDVIGNGTGRHDVKHQLAADVVAILDAARPSADTEGLARQILNTVDPLGSGVEVRQQCVALVRAARPSADAETVRRVRDVSGPSSVDDGGLYTAGWNAAMTEIRAALDGTR